MNHATAAATIVLVTLVFTAANHVNDLNNDQQIKQQLGGEAKMRVDCPRDANKNCEPPITVSFDTPNSKNSEYCQTNTEPEFDDAYAGDYDDDDYVPPPAVDSYVDTSETIYYTWRLKSDNVNTVSTINPENDPEIFSILPCERVDVGATENVVIKYRHCVYKNGNENCGPLRTKEIKIASYDPDKINDNARPPKDGKMVYFRSGVRFKGQSGDILFPSYKFNTTGFRKSLVKALNSARKKCSPGEETCKEEFDPVLLKNIRILNIDDGGNKKDVLFEVRVPTEDGIPIQNRLLHPYFKYPLSAKLVLDGLIPHYNYEPQLEIDSSKAKLLEPLPEAVIKLLLNSKLAGGIIALIVIGAVVVLIGLVYVARKASQNKAKAKMLNTKSAELDVKSAQLDAEGKKIASRYNELLQREKELNNKVENLKRENEKMEAEKKKLEEEEHRIKDEQAKAEAALAAAQEAGDASAVEKAKVDMSSIAAKLSSIGRKKEDAAAEVDRLTAEQERVRKELNQEVIKQKNEQHRKLQERLAKRKKKTSGAASVVPLN